MGRRMRGGSNGFGFGDLLGMFNFHSVVMCKSDDDSLYCQLMKLINMVFGFVFISAIFYFVYMVFIKKSGFKTKRRR